MKEEHNYSDSDYYKLEREFRCVDARRSIWFMVAIGSVMLTILLGVFLFTSSFTSEKLGNAVCLEQANATYDTYGIFSGILYCNPSTAVQRYDGLYLVVRD